MPSEEEESQNGSSYDQINKMKQYHDGVPPENGSQKVDGRIVSCVLWPASADGQIEECLCSRQMSSVI